MSYGTIPGSPYKNRSTSRDFVNIAIAEDQARIKAMKEQEAIAERARRQNRDASIKAYENIGKQQSRFAKFTSFTETVRDQLLESAIYTLASKAIKKVDEAQGTNIMGENINETSLHAMIFQFIHENNGAASLLAQMRMHGHTYYLTETYGIITEHFKKIVESVDKTNPDTLFVSNDISDSFKASIDSEDTDIMAETISDRVIAAIEEFIESGKKDKEDIVTALNLTKDKLDSIDSDREDIKESYSRIGKRFVTEVRERKHGLFSEMVSSIAKEVMKNPDLQANFMEGTSINVGKIVDKVTIMYSFLETVNTMRLKRITPQYIREHVMAIN